MSARRQRWVWGGTNTFWGQITLCPGMDHERPAAAAHLDQKVTSGLVVNASTSIAVRYASMRSRRGLCIRNTIIFFQNWMRIQRGIDRRHQWSLPRNPPLTDPSSETLTATCLWWVASIGTGWVSHPGMALPVTTGFHCDGQRQCDEHWPFHAKHRKGKQPATMSTLGVEVPQAWAILFPLCRA